MNASEILNDFIVNYPYQELFERLAAFMVTFTAIIISILVVVLTFLFIVQYAIFLKRYFEPLFYNTKKIKFTKEGKEE